MKKVFIIAEAGVNHNGELDLAKKLVDVAVESKADAVKFQTWNTDLLLTQSAKQARYQTSNTGIEESQFQMVKKLELPHSDFLRLKEYCDMKQIIFMSTPDDLESAIFLSNLQNIFKIGSGAVTDLHLLRYVGGLKKSIILSTGMATINEIEDALEVLERAGTPRNRITILHCTSEYPAPMSDVNLRAMSSMRETFGTEVGYSDHTLGIEVATAAVALGATVIEKHFTLDVNLPGPDHIASLNPIELKSMITAIRNIELAMGDGVKRVMPSEIENRTIVRKAIVASRAIGAGELFTADNITTKRAGDGISPMRWDEVLGMTAIRSFLEEELIEL